VWSVALLKITRVGEDTPLFKRNGHATPDASVTTPPDDYYFSMGGSQIADEARGKADGSGLKNKLGAMLRTGLEKLRLFMPRAHHMFPSRKGETNMAFHTVVNLRHACKERLAVARRLDERRTVG
jgi:hypothetical protein